MSGEKGDSTLAQKPVGYLRFVRSPGVGTRGCEPDFMARTEEGDNPAVIREQYGHNPAHVVLAMHTEGTLDRRGGSP